MWQRYTGVQDNEISKESTLSYGWSEYRHALCVPPEPKSLMQRIRDYIPTGHNMTFGVFCIALFTSKASYFIKKYFIMLQPFYLTAIVIKTILIAV